MRGHALVGGWVDEIAEWNQAQRADLDGWALDLFAEDLRAVAVGSDEGPRAPVASSPVAALEDGVSDECDGAGRPAEVAVPEPAQVWFLWGPSLGKEVHLYSEDDGGAAIIRLMALEDARIAKCPVGVWDVKWAEVAAQAPDAILVDHRAPGGG